MPYWFSRTSKADLLEDDRVRLRASRPEERAGQRKLRLPTALPVEREEEEGLVLHDRTADRARELLDLVVRRDLGVARILDEGRRREGELA